jgi:gamma-glutamylcyclotransferase (GGCT)/AIG2-like uncharacterized protein YtfP
MIAQDPLRIFVYGTLKRGASNHAAHCTGALRIDDGWTWGRLHILGARYPILDPARVLAIGTRDYPGDIARLSPPPAAMEGGPAWRRIRGELMEFADGEVRLPRLDALEDYDPDGWPPSHDLAAHGLREEGLWYQRAMIVAERADGALVLAWTYVVPEDFGARFPAYDHDAWDESDWHA